MIKYDYYEDLGPCNLFGDGNLTAVGWLDPYHTFSKGEVPREFLAKLALLLEHSWHPYWFAGGLVCGFCDEGRGGHNLFIPYQDGLFVSPQLIGHYIEAHGYQPPEVYQMAVMACPPMLSDDYFHEVRSRGYDVSTSDVLRLRKQRDSGAIDILPADM